MNKILFIAILIPSLSYAIGAQGQTITAQNIPTIQKDMTQLYYDVNQLNAFANSAETLINANYEFSVPGSTDTVQMTAQQQSDMLAAYETLKANVQTDINNLP